MRGSFGPYLAPLVDALMALPEPLKASQAQAEARAERLVIETNLEPAHALKVLEVCLGLPRR